MEKAIYEEIKKHIKNAEERLKVMKQEIEKAEKAGLDVSALKSKYRELSQKVSLLKAVYGS